MLRKPRFIIPGVPVHVVQRGRSRDPVFYDDADYSSLLSALCPAKYVNDQFGLPAISDIRKEVENPGRESRPEFTSATFREGIEQLSDLKPDMILEGVITNVAAFGAFVDIGVHQDGLVHISAISNSFVKDPHTIVKAGQVVKVKVLEVDEKRKRIALTMRLTDIAPQPHGKPEPRNTQRQQDSLSHKKSAVGDKQREPPRATPNAMAAAFSKLKT